ncbi:hypothetical protein Glove_174g104 [Diversispora epigaea]|uniref:Uncharacterized protein n=1 Tax=Diversispora epigaea TaxID=1348612 RepID=A0A397IXT0_9GLOM|nr:hypothetical protein Glove_174g104 [Diversispora epigaea]
MEIGDLSKEKSMKYLAEMHKITKAEKLYELVGGRILELKAVAYAFSSGKSIEAGKRVINALLSSKEISIEKFKKLFANEEEYGEVLEANVFAFHPSKNTVSFQSQSIEYYIRKRSDVFVDLVNLTSDNNSNYASTSKS